MYYLVDFDYCCQVYCLMIYFDVYMNSIMKVEM